MDDRIDFFVPQDVLYPRPVADICQVEREAAPGDFADAPESFLPAVGQVVNHRHRVAGPEELDAGVAADVAGAARGKNAHNLLY